MPPGLSQWPERTEGGDSLLTIIPKSPPAAWWGRAATARVYGCKLKESESEVAESCLTLCDPMDCSLPGSSVHGIFQARVLEWAAISFSKESSRPRDWTWVSRIAGRHFTIWATREAKLSNSQLQNKHTRHLGSRAEHCHPKRLLQRVLSLDFVFPLLVWLCPSLTQAHGDGPGTQCVPCLYPAGPVHMSKSLITWR